MAHSAETRKKLSDATRRTMTPERRAANSEATRKQWAEPVSKLREAAKSLERKNKISASTQGRPKPFNMRPIGLVADPRTGRIFIRIYTGWARQARVIWTLHHGPIPTGYYIHHINRDCTDDRIENLMCMTPREHTRLHRSI